VRRVEHATAAAALALHVQCRASYASLQLTLFRAQLPRCCNNRFCKLRFESIQFQQGQQQQLLVRDNAAMLLLLLCVCVGGGGEISMSCSNLRNKAKNGHHSGLQMESTISPWVSMQLSAMRATWLTMASERTAISS
jgi:hypothetical protein